MKYFKKLLGDNIFLSPKNADDETVEKFTKWLNDFNTTDYIGRSSTVYTLQGEREYLQNNSNQEASFFIIESVNNNLIGTISLENIDHINRKATLGIFIGDTGERNKGYGAEAINLILDYGFNYLNLNNIKLDVFEFNERAYKCYQKCGFKLCGRRRKCVYLNGNYYDVLSMDILKDEFQGNFIRNKNI